MPTVWLCGAAGHDIEGEVSAGGTGDSLAVALLASSKSIAPFAQPCFPDGTGIVQASCRCRIVRRAAAWRECRRGDNGG
jgi:hypothetical protein